MVYRPSLSIVPEIVTYTPSVVVEVVSNGRKRGIERDRERKRERERERKLRRTNMHRQVSGIVIEVEV